MFMRVKRWKKWKSKRRFDKAFAKKRLMEEQDREDRKPTDSLHQAGSPIVVRVYCSRSLWNRKKFVAFEFGKSHVAGKHIGFDPRIGPHDLDDLRQAIDRAEELSRQLLGPDATRKGFSRGYLDFGRSNGESGLPVR